MGLRSMESFEEKVKFLQQGGSKIFESNMKALETYHPQLWHQVKAAKNTDKYFVARTDPRVVANLYSVASDLLYYSGLDPLTNAKQEVEDNEINNSRMAVFCGFGLGYELLYFLDVIAFKQSVNHILVVERDIQLFTEALKTTNFVQVFKEQRIQFMVGKQLENLFVEFQKYLAADNRFIYLKATNFICHSSSAKLSGEYYRDMISKFREAGHFHTLYYGNDPNDSLIGIKNMLDNIGEIISNPGINLLYNKFSKRPAVIVSTGPSLNKNKHLLKGLEDKALLICPDASLRLMMDMGVKPHLVTSLERTSGVRPLVADFSPESVQDVYYAACPVIENQVYEAYNGPRIIVYRDYDHFRWLEIDKGILDIKLSSGNMAFKLAEALGCDPIILIGQDLAFSRDGRTHAEGTYKGERQDYFLNQKMIEVPGNDGKPIYTSRSFFAFLKSYELDVSKYKGLCINATEGGAYINGTKVIPFAEAIEKYISNSFNPLGVIKQAISEFSHENITSDRQKVRKLLSEAITDMDTIINLCIQGTQVHEEYRIMLEKCVNSQCELDLDGIKEIEKRVFLPKNQVLNNFKKTNQLLMQVVQSFYVKFEMDMAEIPGKTNDRLKAAAKIILSQRVWYETVASLTKIVKDVLEEAEKKNR